jgi:hypothetical protein
MKDGRRTMDNEQQVMDSLSFIVHGSSWMKVCNLKFKLDSGLITLNDHGN